MRASCALAIAGLVLAMPAAAELAPGTAAPAFTAQASLDGKEFTFSLQDALGRGPVVLYFFPAAFTKGCTAEAHAFAEAMDQFQALGASVVGVSEDKIDVLDRFSVSACQSRFPVAADDGSIAKAYDAVLKSHPNLASRTSFVITPDAKVISVHTDMNPDSHVDNTLAALKQWRSSNKS